MNEQRVQTGALASTLQTESAAEQTQVVACIDAILHLAKFSHGDVTLRPDCNAGVDGLRQVLRGESPQFGPNADRWFKISEALKVRQGSMAVKRVDAHADVRAYIEQEMPISDWIGNELADTLAGLGADVNSVSLQAESNWSFLIGRAKKILSRVD